MLEANITRRAITSCAHHWDDGSNLNSLSASVIPAFAAKNPANLQYLSSSPRLHLQRFGSGAGALQHRYTRIGRPLSWNYLFYDHAEAQGPGIHQLSACANPATGHLASSLRSRVMLHNHRRS